MKVNTRISYRVFLPTLAFFQLIACGSTPSNTPSDQPDTGYQESTVDASTPDSPPDVHLTDALQDMFSEASTDGGGKTTVRVHYPAGSKSISIRGSTGPLNWQQGVSMSNEGNNTWTYSLSNLNGPLEWKPLLEDSTWSKGPNYKVIPGQSIDVYPHFTRTDVTVEKKWIGFQSTEKQITQKRDITVLLPPTYTENSTVRLPVVYMHDGNNLFDPTLAFQGQEWKVDETLQSAAESGLFREAIVVCIYNSSDRIPEYTPTATTDYPSAGHGDAYLSMIVKEIKPMVDGAYRTLPEREHTAVIGSSLGGLISAYAGTKHPQTFGLIGAMSPSTWWDNKVIINMVASTKTSPLKPLRVYLDSGDSGNSQDGMVNTAELAKTYKDIGYVENQSLKYVVQAGATHSEFYWAQRLPGALQFLLGPREYLP